MRKKRLAAGQKSRKRTKRNTKAPTGEKIALTGNRRQSADIELLHMAASSFDAPPSAGSSGASSKKQERRRRWAASLVYGFVRSRELDGTLNESPRVGVYIVTCARILASWGYVSEKRWPKRKGLPWPPPEPPGLDKIAKHNRTLMHYRVRNIAELKHCLARKGPVQLAVPIYAGWYTAPGEESNYLPQV